MITAEKIKQVRKQLRSGVPEGEIKNELLSQGYTEEDIAKVFVAYRPDMRNWCLGFAVLFLLLGINELISNSSIWFLLFSTAMFAAYYFEVKRIERSVNK